MMVQNDHLVLRSASCLSVIETPQSHGQSMVVILVAVAACLFVDEEAIDAVVTIEAVAVGGEGGLSALPEPEVTHLVDKGVVKAHGGDFPKTDFVSNAFRIPQHICRGKSVVDALKKLPSESGAIAVEFIGEVSWDVVGKCGAEKAGSAILHQKRELVVEGWSI